MTVVFAVILAVPRSEWYGPLARSIDTLVGLIAEGAALGPLLGFGVGVLLGLSPVALPTIPAVVTVLTPAHAGDATKPPALSTLRAVPVLAAFVVGMDGVVALAGYAFVEFTVAIARASVVLHLSAAALLLVAGLRLVTRRTSLCRRTRSIPPTPGRAFTYGVGFAIGGCPGCAPISLGVGLVAATFGPLYALAVIAAFVAGHTAILLAVAVAGSRWVRRADPASPRWARLDVAVGVLFLLAAGYYLFRVGSGTATTALPGESGGLIP